MTWSVYGAGEYEAEMRENIRKHKLEGVISIEGVVPYHRFWQVLSDAYIFVGMGTALLEAALFKVPNFCALPYDRTGLTYGSSRMLPPGSNGQLSTVKPGNMMAEIERILALTPAEYEAEAELVVNHVQVHQIRRVHGAFSGDRPTRRADGSTQSGPLPDELSALVCGAGDEMARGRPGGLSPGHDQRFIWSQQPS